jgi:hypothetical protein
MTDISRAVLCGGLWDSSLQSILLVAEFPEYGINSEYCVDKIISEKVPPPPKKKGY